MGNSPPWNATEIKNMEQEIGNGHLKRALSTIFSQKYARDGIRHSCYILTEVKVNFVRSRASFVEARIQLR